MESFDLVFSPHIHFGADVVDQIGATARTLGERVLVLHGSFALSSGLFERIAGHLEAAGYDVITGSPVTANPAYDEVVSLAREVKGKDANWILAVGGGSVIDTAKTLAGLLLADDELEFWEDHFLSYQSIERALPIVAVPTIPASGSETSESAVISDPETGQKRIASGPALVPVHAFLDPTLTLSLSRYQTACGLSDMLSHLNERYFSPVEDTHLSDQLLEGVMRFVIDAGPSVLADPHSLALRSEIMWAGTLAHSTLLDRGRGGGDWACHMIEHALSAVSDVAHGAGLAIITPAWLRFIGPFHPDHISAYAQRVWRIPSSSPDTELEAVVGALSSWYRNLGLPTRLSEIGIERTQLRDIASLACPGPYPIGSLHPLASPQVEEILHIAF